MLGHCEYCAIGKAKQKNVIQRSKHVKAKIPGYRIFLDIKTLRKPKEKNILFVEKNNMRMLVDEFSGCGFTRWFSTKDGMVEPTIELFNMWKQNGIDVSIIRCDNAGENMRLEKRLASAEWKMPLKFEYTARNTPQQNHLAELKIFLICNKARAALVRAHVPNEYRFRIFPKFVEGITQLDWLVTVEIENVTKTRIEHFGKQIPKFAKKLRILGEAGVVTTKKKMQSAIQDRGTLCMFVSYCPNADGDVYTMYDPITNQGYRTRDIIWLKRMYFPIKKKEEANFEWEDDDERKHKRKKSNKNFKYREEDGHEPIEVNELEWLPQNNSDNVLNDENDIEYEGENESEKEIASENENKEKNHEIHDQDNETIRTRSQEDK